MVIAPYHWNSPDIILKKNQYWSVNNRNLLVVQKTTWISEKHIDRKIVRESVLRTNNIKAQILKEPLGNFHWPSFWLQ